MKRGHSIVLPWCGQAVLLALLAFFMVWVAGCHKDSNPYMIGQFVDGPVEGLTFQSVAATGETDAKGGFGYYQGERVTFYVGGVSGLRLGDAKGASVLSPIDLVPSGTSSDPKVINIARFIQTLDADGDYSNGIKITSAIADKVAAYVAANGAINFDQTTAAFEADARVAGLLAALNNANLFTNKAVAGDRLLRGIADARAHLEASIQLERIIQTANGTLSGYTDGTVSAWRGIPYATPPVGDWRWRAPQDPQSWSGKRLARDSGAPAVQHEMDRTWHQTGRIIGSEDCLYLDVYRPDTSETMLPVYFWIHGGSNKFGAASGYMSKAKIMAKKLNVVVVIIQYRLGPLGWFRHAGLRNDDAADMGNSGNFGTLDQIQALKWVRTNIKTFGGDPDNITIAGQSAGGHNVMNLVISPLAKGLFHKAVSQSGIMPVIKAEDTIANDAATALGLTNGTVAQKLRAKTAREILQATAAVSTFSAFADGNVVPDTVINALHQGNYNKVPIIVGYNQNEWNDFLPLYGAAFGKTVWGKVYDLFDATFDPAKSWTYAEIFPNSNEERVYQDMGRITSLNYRAKYLDELAHELKMNQNEVYAYLFKWAGGGVAKMEEYRKIFGAAHSMEIVFFFGGDDDLFGYSFIPENESGRKALQDAMGTYLGNFMRTGDPGKVGSMTWDAWSNSAATGVPKAITFDANASSAVIGFENTEISFADVNTSITSILAGWDADYRNAWGNTVQVLATAKAETLRFTARNHLQLAARTGAKAYGGTYGYYVNSYSGYQIAGYWIEIPDNWNKKLVLYCHGYRGTSPLLSISAPSIRSHLADNGYAWAASSYGENGYQIATGVVGTHELLKNFKVRFGNPEKVYIIGHSMGGHVTARSVTQYPEAYNGALPMCGVVGGAQEQFSHSMDMALLANYFSGLNYNIGSEFTTNESTFLETVFGLIVPETGRRSGNGVFGFISASSSLPYVYTSAQAAVLNAQGESLKNAAMYRSGGKRPLYDASFSNQAYFQIVGQGVQFAKNPALGSATGNMVDNQSQVYQLDDDYASQSMAELSLNTDIKRVAISSTFDYDNIMFPVHGNITIPVMTLHDMGDYFVPFSHEVIYADKVRQAGKSHLLKQRIIRSISHCGMNATETVEAFNDLVAWAEHGAAPDGDDLLDRAKVAADNFGCRFTRAQRAGVDPDVNGSWICSQ
ncbi:MAG: carboxylesterase family protein [Deltaproteobacteria bacterium]|nr:carboxylesterase family protein [Deltaproteobacteria bacterium]